MIIKTPRELLDICSSSRLNRCMDGKAKRNFKDALFGEFERIGKAVASGRRLEIIELLAQAERSVEELAEETSQSVANTSQHLQVLRQAQLVENRREGTFVRY